MIYAERQHQRPDQMYLSISLVPPFSDQFQVSSKMLRETEEVRQNISKLNKEVG